MKLGPALIAGNTAVMKTAEQAPLAVMRSIEIMQQFLPPGVANVISGFGAEAGKPLAEHPLVKKITFTGSGAVGRAILHYAADKLCPISDAFLAGWSELGVPVLDDYNASGPDGAGYLQVSIRKGRRSGAADGYIRPARTRPNLTVLTGAVAQKVVFQGEVATGVVFTHNGKTMQAEATRETILCAGAVRTPQLLELSGVGNKALLEELGIPVVLDRYEVGENLQDHLMARICFETNQTATLNHMLSHRRAQVKEALKYMFFRTGLLEFLEVDGVRTKRPQPTLA